MRRIAAFLAPAFLLACSSSESTPAGPTDTGSAAADTSTTMDTAMADTGSAATDSGPEVVFSTTCGTAPYVTWKGNFLVQGLSGTTPPTGVKITSPGCPGSTFTTDMDGNYTIQIQKDLKSYIRVTADDTIPAIVGESLADADANDINLVLLPTLLKGFLSDWKAGEPAILVKVSAAGAATGTCKNLDGVTLSVKDQPSAKVSYFSNSSPPSVVSGATATTASGIAVITGVTGSLVELVGTKTGCTATPILPPLTGKTAIEPDYVTEAAMVLGN
jgi:hypothetical protein